MNKKKPDSEGLKLNPDICQWKLEKSALIILVQDWAVCCALFQCRQLSATEKKRYNKNTEMTQKKMMGLHKWFWKIILRDTDA